jgi:threonine dehydratase
MTSTERLPYETLAPTDANGVCKDIARRRDDLDTQFNNLEGYGIGAAELVLHAADGDNESVVIDISGHPGDAFKFVSALGSSLTLPEEAQTGLVPSAGNFSKGFNQVCGVLGLRGVAYTPVNVNRVKARDMVANGMEVRPHYENVAEAIPAAWNDSQNDPTLAFMHPYDNPDGIAALTVLADQVIGGMLKLEADSRLDLQQRDVQILVQRGGGSLITAVACRIHQAKAAGLLGPNVTVHEVRPETLADGSLDPEFDGLKVDEPGSYAAPVLRDQAFVEGTYYVSRPAVADAMRQVAEVSAVSYETNALVGLGAVRQVAPHTSRPTTFISLLTGRNATPEQRQAFMAMPGLDENAEPTETSADRSDEALSETTVQLLGSALLSGYTAAYRTHTPLPNARLQDPNPYRSDPEVLDAYYDQLYDPESDTGIILLRSSRQHH